MRHYVFTKSVFKGMNAMGKRFKICLQLEPLHVRHIHIKTLKGKCTKTLVVLKSGLKELLFYFIFCIFQVVCNAFSCFNNGTRDWGRSTSCLKKKMENTTL